MKILTICTSFLKKNIFPICITAITLTISVFMLITILGKYEYQTYTLDIFEASDLHDAFYCMPTMIGEDDIDTAKSLEMQNCLNKMNGVYEIFNYRYTQSSYNNNGCNVFFYDEKFRKNFQLTIQEGEWFGDNPVVTEAIVGGVIWDGIEIGDTINLQNGISAKVIGIIGDSVVYPSLSYTSNSIITADNLFKELDNVIFISEENIVASIIDDMNLRYANNFFIRFEDGITSEKRNAIIKYIESQGNYRECQQIIRDSYIGVNNWIKENLPLPLFLICIATINMICICAVIIKRTMPDMSKYYLIGCTKTKSIKIISISMLSVFTPPIIFNLIQAIHFPHLIRLKINNLRVDYIINADCIYPVILYAGILLVIFICIPTVFYRRYAPLDLYRRNL